MIALLFRRFSSLRAVERRPAACDSQECAANVPALASSTTDDARRQEPVTGSRSAVAKKNSDNIDADDQKDWIGNGEPHEYG